MPAKPTTSAGATSASSADDAGDSTAPTPPELSYEEARDELVGVVTQLEAGTATLDESLSLWERAEQLAATCTYWLDGARRRLAAYESAADGGGSAEGASADRAGPDRAGPDSAGTDGGDADD